MFDVPAWAIGAVTVVVLLAVILYPREAPQSVIALSSVTLGKRPETENLPGRSETDRDNHRFERFSSRGRSTKIDALYDAVAPTMDIYERYYVAPPAAIRDAVRKGLVDPSDRTKMLRGLKDHLDLNKVVFITAVSRAEGIAFEAELIDISTGTILGKKTESKLAETDLGPEIRRAALHLLLEH